MNSLKLSLLLTLSLFTTQLLAAKERAIPVNFIILQEDTGQGNEAWTKDDNYIDGMLKKINTNFYKMSDVELVKGYKKIVKSSRDYHSPMSRGKGALINRYSKYDKTGHIIVVVAREEKVDVNGRAKKQGYTYSPVMIVRTVVNGSDPAQSDWVAGEFSQDVTAGLFVHEMGHMIDLKHEGTLTTENYTVRPDGIARYQKYLRRLAK